MNNQLIKNLQSVSFFRGLSEAELDHICAKSRLLSFKKDDIIFCQGDEASAFFIIIRGWVTIAKENINAEQSILHVFQQGESFAEPAAMIMGKYPASAYAASSCDVLEINIAALKTMVQQEPDMAMRMIARLSGQLNTLINEFEQYKTMSVPKRLAMFLISLITPESGTNSVELPFSKTVLSAHLGVQPATLSRAFNQLAKFGVSSERTGPVTIGDIDGLRAYIDDSGA